MKLKYGVFLNRYIECGDDWDIMPIGAHAAIRRKQRHNAESASYEYYYKSNGKTFIIENPTIIEKMAARLTLSSNKVVGYRSESTYLSDTTELKEILSKEKNGLER